jgi:methylated-DNA-[protein]-cysteine S-methyltransferase
MNNTHTWTQKSPFGKLIISAGAKGVYSVLLNSSKHAGRTPHMDGLPSTAPREVRAIGAAFERYFNGNAHALDSIRVDLSDVKGEFQLTVLETLRKLVGAGATMSYGELAAAAGRPGAARAVGYAMAHNPVPLIVPCHRVLASDGTLGGYGGGLEMKRHLLRIEGVQLAGGRKPR